MAFASPRRIAVVVFGSLLAASGCEASSDEPTGEAELAVRGPVALRYAASRARPGCDTCSSWSGVVDVENMAFGKEVIVFWSVPTSGGLWGPWQETAATFLASASHGRETWSFEGVGQGSLTRLKIRYRVAGREMWDDNGGRNYLASLGPGPYGSGSEYVGLASPMGSGIDLAVSGASVGRTEEGSLLTADLVVRNLAPEKDVGIVYSFDNWRTKREARASFASGDGHSGRGERWRVQVTFPLGANAIQFAARARQNDREVWDNNFTHDFECRLHNASGWQCAGATLLP
jgi:hypothetical protein